MCGIVGALAADANNWPALKERISTMTDTLEHRGPDAGAVWTDEAGRIAFGHRRLAILDLSAAGAQPMSSHSGRYITVFNGEIYNHDEIRAELDAISARSWRGHSDTETLLEAIEAWGVEGAVGRCAGMFAFGVWDRVAEELHVVRDRFGKKPLYYSWSRGTFVFGSELKALRALPLVAPVDRASLSLFVRHGYVPQPYTIYDGVSVLPPATIMTVSARAPGGGRPRVYWSGREIAERGMSRPFRGDTDAAREQLDALLRLAVRQRMMADVPLGAFLSGGVDSSVVVALMQAQSGRPVKTFTIGFYEDQYDEAKYAKAVAEHLGTEHTELYVTPEEAMAVIPRLAEMFDDPFADSSQIPTFLVAQLARRHVTVALSGDGGDELFGGYNRYLLGTRLWKRISWIPPPVRRVLASGPRALAPGAWDRLAERLGPAMPVSLRQRNLGTKMHKVSEVLGARDQGEFYRWLVSHWRQPSDVVLGASEPPTILTDPSRWASLRGFTSEMMFFDMTTYLTDDILVKVDRATMAVSLEARAPLLDHRLAEFAWRLPLAMKVREGKGKWILRQVLRQYVPDKLIERPKAGFAVPIETWLRGPLREWADGLLDEERLRSEGFLDPRPIRQKWREHLSGKHSWHHHLWDILMFELWLERNLDVPRSAQSTPPTTAPSMTR